jgi:hypothetical protein
MQGWPGGAESAGGGACPPGAAGRPPTQGGGAQPTGETCTLPWPALTTASCVALTAGAEVAVLACLGVLRFLLVVY